MSKLKHLGIIADGNRRWAKAHNLPSIEGHRRGIKAIESLVEGAGDAGIDFVTFYVFSTENWGRSKDEVSYLMKLIESQIVPYAKKLAKKNAKLLILGSRKGVSEKLLGLLEEAEQITADGTGMTVCLCFNYGGEQEIADAAAEIVAEDGEITPKTIREHLYHPEVPDVDLVVRTSGEQRISGFMLWRSAYAEFLFLDRYFPEMKAKDIPGIVTEFENRHRRFGK